MSEQPDIFATLASMHPNPKPAPTIRETGSVSSINHAPTADDPRTAGAVKGALSNSHDNIVNARSRGVGRNETLNTEAFNLGQLIANGLLTREQVEDHLMQACRDSGLLADDGHPQCAASMRGGIDAGIASGPRTNLPQMGDPNVGLDSSLAWPEGEFDPDGPETVRPQGHGPGARIVKLKSFDDLDERRPKWVWSYGGAGRIQLGTLSIFGGPPGTGKSTAARWFAAEASNGALTGCWEGQPVNVAYIAVEEDLDAMVKPSLRAAGAEMTNLYYPEVVMDGTTRIIASKADELALTEQLLEYDVRVLIVDPIMSTLGAGTDIHKNNEVREAIQPFVNIAGKMNGLVIGIAHYRKSGAASGVAALTGSSAFGEVARSVFGFMKGGMDPDEPRVMSQSKNSAGREDLALQYKLDLVPVTYSDGVAEDMARFEILGESSVTVEDLMAEGGAQTRTKLDDAVAWLEDYLQINGESASKQIKLDAARDADLSESVLKRAASKLKIVMTNKSIDGKPRVTFWELPPEPESWNDHRAEGPGDDF